jgi:hypothetical protein
VRADPLPETIRITTGPITIDPANQPRPPSRAGSGAAGLALTYGIGYLFGTAVG